MQLPFGEWLPDQPEHLNTGANVAHNVYYAAKSYKPFPSLVSYSSNTTAKDARGAGSFRDSSSNVFNFVGTNTDIFQLASGSFTSKQSGLNGTNTDYMTFTQFGDHVIASNGVDAPKYWLMGTSSSFASLSSIAADGTPPVFRVSGVIRDFLVTGNQANNTNRVQWSGLNDIATWTPGSKSADLQDLPGSGGKIVHITSGEVGYVFRQNQIVRMDFVGGRTIFRFSVISPNRGAVYGKTVCQDDRRVFFLADDGFFEISGDTLSAIGAEKVNRFFENDVNKAFMDRICAAVDPFNTLAIWLYPSKDDPTNTTGICDKLLIYNYVTKKWSTSVANASMIFSQFVGQYTVELMDLISENLDDINISLDTNFWQGGQLFLGGIDNNFKSAIFSGTGNVAEIETGEVELFPGFITNVTGIRPIVDATASVILKTRNRVADTPTSSASSSMDSTGFNAVRQSGRYVRANVTIPANSVWNHAQGVDFTATSGGAR